MSKYDFELDLSRDSSTGLILEKIQKGADVLEFGCAAGRMTRYMQQAMGCSVSIVELDRDAFEAAMAYAQRGVCGDIMAFDWLEEFGQLRFDAILFADVLEHLPQPGKVLAAAATLLKPQGRIYASIPNITHNDLLLKACADRFDYTDVGLLDDTHIHFWGRENLEALAREAGLHLRSLEATYCPMGATEQQPQMGGDVFLENSLLQRPCGQVYQFVFSLSPQAGAFAESMRTPSRRAHIYLDTGEGFNPRQVLPVEMAWVEADRYSLSYTLEEAGQLQAVRLDPVEGQGCILEAVSVTQGQRELAVTYSQSVSLAQGVFLMGEDPMLIAQVEAGGAPVTVQARVLIPGKPFIRALEQDARDTRLALQQQREQAQAQEAAHALQAQQLQAQIRELEAQIRELSRQKTALILEGEEKDARIHGLHQQQEALQKEKRLLEDQLLQLRIDVGSYIALTNEKENYILSLERLVDTQAKRLQQLDQALRYRMTLKGLLKGLAGWTLRKLKRIARKLTGKRSDHE